MFLVNQDALSRRAAVTVEAILIISFAMISKAGTLISQVPSAAMHFPSADSILSSSQFRNGAVLSTRAHTYVDAFVYGPSCLSFSALLCNKGTGSLNI